MCESVCVFDKVTHHFYSCINSNPTPNAEKDKSNIDDPPHLSVSLCFSLFLSLSLGLPLCNSLMIKSSSLLLSWIFASLFRVAVSSTFPPASLHAGSVAAVVCRVLSTPTGLCLSVVTDNTEKPLCHFPLSSGLYQVNQASLHCGSNSVFTCT